MASPNNIAQLPRIKPGRRGALAQLLELQRVAYETAIDPETTASARAQLTRAWCELEERKRILRMKPLPKSVDPEKFNEARRAARRRAAAPDFIEPGADEPGEPPVE